MWRNCRRAGKEPLWWLILCINLAGPLGYPVIRANIILDMSMRVFLDAINIWMVDFAKQMALPKVHDITQSLEGLTRKKADVPWIGRHSSFLTAFQAGTSVFCLWLHTETLALLGSQAYQLSLWNLHHQISWVFSLLTADLEASQPP